MMRRDLFVATTLLIANLAFLGLGGFASSARGSASGRTNPPKRSVSVQAAPVITTARLFGKKLVVTGDNFEEGAVVVVDGTSRATNSHPDTPATKLISEKAGKKLIPGTIVRLQVRNPDGMLSGDLLFYSGCGDQ